MTVTDLGDLTLDGVWMGQWPYQHFLPRHPKPAVEDEPGDGRINGLIDEAN
ncbi:hypothetical protein ACIBEJ_35170 [Nonomuraea sp. NPDC050790]|uniref:hypothetical protein n=1 Tax=Nonomuraea sp. NPDC050790 TaxID=3364371 RepID=UPI0037B3500D